MDDTTSTRRDCAGCGKTLPFGSYFIVGGKVLCPTCAVGPAAQAQALAHDAARKEAERAQAPQRAEAVKLCGDLEVEARKLAVAMLGRVGVIAGADSFKGLKALDEQVLAETERLVKLAQQLDVLADKLFVRGS